MRFLLLFAIALFVAWRLRRWWSQGPGRSVAPPSTPTAMLPCRHCGVHVPSADMVSGLQGAYCCAAHRAAAEG